MTAPSAPQNSNPALDGQVDDELQKKLDKLIEEEEGTQSKFSGWVGVLITLALLGMSFVHLYAAYGIIPASTLRPLHVAMVVGRFSCRLLVVRHLLLVVGRRRPA
ncbi:MAG: hypothetical protein RL424_481 [Pseudomonadota bacterium]